MDDTLDFEQIVAAIKRVVREDQYPLWRIGITNNLSRRKGEHEREGRDTKDWRGWTAIGEATAIKVEEKFLDLGMKGGKGEDEDTVQDKVYIF